MAVYLVISMNIGGIIRDGISDAKIDQLKLSLYQHEIGWFEIRMYDLLLVNYMHGL